MKSLFEAETERAIRSRIERLGPDHKALWGRMSAGEMVCHLIDAFRVSLGDIQATPKPGAFTFPPVRWLVIHVMPWPKGKIPTTPEFQTTRPEKWQADVRTWNEWCDRFLARGRSPQPSFTDHPAFGRMPVAEWGHLFYRHTDHHLRQFGV